MKWHLILLTWIGLVKIIWTLIEICSIPLFHFWMSIDFRGTKSLFIATRGNRGLRQLAYYIYIARLGAFKYADFDTSVQKLKEIYPVYMPKRNIFLTVKSLWRDFVQNPVEEVNT